VKSLMRRRPSPAMIVALVALFVSLSGVSYGVATGFIDSREIKNNEVRSIDIRNNEVRTRDLRNNEVRGIDIRNSTVQGRDIGLNTVTGEDVREDTLQKVPSALLADSATSAGSADDVKTLKIIPRTVQPEAASGALVLLEHGPFTLRAECRPNTTATSAQITLQTSEDDSGARSEETNAPVFDASNGEQIMAVIQDAAGGERTMDFRHITAIAPSGKTLTGEFILLPDAAANTCTFAGHAALGG